MDILTSKLTTSRRNFLTSFATGTSLAALAGVAGCSSSLRGGPQPGKVYNTDPGRARVAFTSGSGRRENLATVLEPFREEIQRGIQGKQVVIKLNCVGQNGQELMVTHPDAVRATLDFLTPMTDQKIIVAESAVQNANVPPWDEIYGYRALEREYNAVVMELNEQPTTWEWILDNNLYPVRIRIINTLLDPNNYVISLTRLKTHNSVVATLTLKNVVMGSPLKIPQQRINEKSKMHAGNITPKLINFNLFQLAQKVRPDFAVLDGWECVEGNGPANGTPVDHKVALAGPDFLAVDRIGAELMGIPFENIGYLNYCATGGLGQGDRTMIDIIGSDPRDYVIQYKLRDNIEDQMRWDDDLIYEHVTSS